MWNAWTQLNEILQRHEETIRAIWSNKIQAEKEAAFRKIMPNIAEAYSPQAFGKDESEETKEANTKLLETPTDNMLWPYINLENLMREITLLKLLDDRGRQHSENFAELE